MRAFVCHLMYQRNNDKFKTKKKLFLISFKKKNKIEMTFAMKMEWATRLCKLYIFLVIFTIEPFCFKEILTLVR